jgi:hypothetical protein
MLLKLSGSLAALCVACCTRAALPLLLLLLPEVFPIMLPPMVLLGPAVLSLPVAARGLKASKRATQ